MLKGGGVFEKNGITNETTHAILVGQQEDCRAEIAAAMENGAVVLSPRWLEVCTIHRQLVPVQLRLAKFENDLESRFLIYKISY